MLIAAPPHSRPLQRLCRGQLLVRRLLLVHSVSLDRVASTAHSAENLVRSEWPSEVTQEKEEVLVDLRSPAQATTPTPPSIQIQEPSGASRPVAVDTFDPTARKKGTSSKFQHGGISVPDYTWKDDVLLPSSTTSDRFRKLSEVIDWTSELSPRTITTPAQWATVPPNSVWAKGPPKASGTDDRASATDNQPSPHLPITAFTFDTTSAPATPLDKGQGEESPTGSDQKFAVTPTGSSYRPCTPTGEQEVGVEHHWGARIPKMPIQDLSLAFPFGGRPDMAWQHGYTLGWNSFAQAQLARDSDVKLAEIEPTIPLPLHNHAVGAVPHAEMNYRREYFRTLPAFACADAGRVQVVCAHSSCRVAAHLAVLAHSESRARTSDGSHDLAHPLFLPQQARGSTRSARRQTA